MVIEIENIKARIESLIQSYTQIVKRNIEYGQWALVIENEARIDAWKTTLSMMDGE